MVIYPKISENLDGNEYLKEFIKQSKGLEIQFFRDNYKIEETINKIINQIPTIKEITIHPPLESDYNIEVLMFNEYKDIEEKLKLAVKLSKKYNIRINYLYHVEWNILSMKRGPIDKIKELLKIIENTNVTLLLENIYTINERGICTVLEIAQIIDNPKLKVCIDICHVYCQANMFKLNFEDFASKYLDKQLCEKYVYQIHFSATLNNDGYIDKKTHGRMHENMQTLKKDYNLLKKFKMDNKNIITEISEADYLSRKDQLKEIQMLQKIRNKTQKVEKMMKVG